MMRSGWCRAALLAAALLPALLAAGDPAAIREEIARMRVLYQAGSRADADALAARLSAETQGDAALSYSAGMALAQAGQFDKAEAFLAQALAAAPGEFKILYNLGVAATFAGHYERALDALEQASRQQPENVDVLYGLAYAHVQLKQWEPAVGMLAPAARLAPRRADVQKLLGIATTELHAYQDALTAWERYCELEPGDDAGRRERGAAAVHAGKLEQGIADLKWFLARHPDDEIAYYELAIAETDSDPGQAAADLETAIRLKPGFAAARAARGSLNYQQGRPEAALPDLEFAAAHQPDDATVLDRLGQTYVALDRAADAVRVLHKAADLAPDDSTVQLHFARALADAGDTAESKVAMDRFRQLGPAKKAAVPAGLVDFAALTPEEREADYRARVEKAVRENPADAAAQARYLKLLLADGKPDEAASVARRIAGARPNAAVQAEAGRTLLQAGQFALAVEFFEKAEPSNPAEGPSSEVLLLKAMALELAGRTADAEGVLREIQKRWPEWYLGWMAHAVILDTHGNYGRAREAIEKAIAMGAHSAEAYYCLADATRRSTPERSDATSAAASQALETRLFQTKPLRDW